MAQMADMFNTNSDFQEYVSYDDTHERVLPDILRSLNPSAPPSPGPLTGDQLLKVINWTRRTATALVNKYDVSGHLAHGPERLQDIYENFCQGALCPEPIDHPKAACFLFAAFGLAFNQVGSFLLIRICIHIPFFCRAIIQLGGVACCQGIQDVFSALRLEKMEVMQLRPHRPDRAAQEEAATAQAQTLRP
jgi:hypothetical protein